MNKVQIGKISEDSLYSAILTENSYGELTNEMRQVILQSAIIQPEIQHVLLFVPMYYEIKCNKRYRLVLESNPKYLRAKPHFHRYIDFISGQIGSNLEFTLDNGIQILILFPNFYQTDGFMISQEYGQKLIPSKNFRPVFWTEEYYKKYIEFRVRSGITPEIKKLHDEILLGHTVKNCRIFIRPPDCDSYYLLGPGLAHLDQKIMEIMPRLFEIDLKKLNNILLQLQYKGFKDPRTQELRRAQICINSGISAKTNSHQNLQTRGIEYL